MMVHVFLAFAIVMVFAESVGFDALRNEAGWDHVNWTAIYCWQTLRFGWHLCYEVELNSYMTTGLHTQHCIGKLLQHVTGASVGNWLRWLEWPHSGLKAEQITSSNMMMELYVKKFVTSVASDDLSGHTIGLEYNNVHHPIWWNCASKGFVHLWLPRQGE